MADQPGNGDRDAPARVTSRVSASSRESYERTDAAPLSERLRAGDQSALAELVLAYVANLQRWVRRQFRDQLAASELEDVVFEGIERLWEARSGIDPCRSLWDYLCRIVHNVAANRLKALWHKQFQAESYTDPALLASVIESQHGTIARPSAALRPIRRAVRAAVARLSDSQRAVVWADAVAPDGVACVHDLSVELGISGDAVRSLRSRARRNLRRDLADKLPPALKKAALDQAEAKRG